MMYPVVILAGGLATRLRPLTVSLPKSMLEINGEPFIAHQLRLLRQQNIREVILCLGYLGEQVKAYVKEGHAFDLKVSYSFDGPTLLGTAGAIKKALPLLPDCFFVLYGDSYLTCDYKAVQLAFMQQHKEALMTVFLNQGQWDTSNVEFIDNEIKAYDKKHFTPNMHYIDYGLGLFNKTVFEALPDNMVFDLADVYQTALRQKQLAAHLITERFYEVGSFNGIKELEQILT